VAAPDGHPVVSYRVLTQVDAGWWRKTSRANVPMGTTRFAPGLRNVPSWRSGVSQGARPSLLPERGGRGLPQRRRNHCFRVVTSSLGDEEMSGVAILGSIHGASGRHVGGQA
jgi:hypothetical protein